MTYAKINENGQLTYATIKNGALIVNDKMVFAPKSEYQKYGYYPVKNIAENPIARMGNVVLDEENGVILNYIGAPYEPSEYEKKQAEIRATLSNNEELIKAVERMVAANGATEEDKAMAQAQRLILQLTD